MDGRAASDNRVETAKVLAGDEMVNWKDCESNTALHIAVANKNVEIISYLLTQNELLQGNALDKNGSTPLDILRQSPPRHGNRKHLAKLWSLELQRSKHRHRLLPPAKCPPNDFV